MKELIFFFLLIPTLIYGAESEADNGTETSLINLKFLELLPENLTNSFLDSLFNSSLSNFLTIAERFKFCNVELSELKFLVFRQNQTEPMDIVLYKNEIDMNTPTKVLIHGWWGNGDNDFIKRLAKQYHKKGRYNIIGVDWSSHSKRDYIAASCTTRDIGGAITEFLLKHIKGDLKMLSNIHLIGHSLGAQVAAFAGKEMINKTGRKIGRITGLDAAAPLFEFPLKVPKGLRLHMNDAEYVDGIHTNMGLLGFASAFGTSDFFIGNGSPIQPGCSTNNFFEDLLCSHARAVDLFEESIMSKKLIGKECPNPFIYRIGLCFNGKRANLGEEVQKTVKGNYFLETYDKPPYGKG